MAGAKEVKNFLKENGIDTKNIRVNSSSSINVKLLDPKLDYDKIEQLLKEKFESYQRDEGSGEILSGGNTFVFIEYDYDLVKETENQLKGSIRPFLEKCSGHWSINSLVSHYLEQNQLEINPRLAKRALKEVLFLYLKENLESFSGLFIDGWN